MQEGIDPATNALNMNLERTATHGQYTSFAQIGIGGSLSDCAPATPPGMRVRTGRFEKLRS